MPKVKIQFGEKPEMPEQEGMSSEEHGVHMEEMKAGLQQILASDNIDEIKSIAQNLLGEEQKEQTMDAGEAPMGKEGFNQGLDKILGQ